MVVHACNPGTRETETEVVGGSEDHGHPQPWLGYMRPVSEKKNAVRHVTLVFGRVSVNQEQTGTFASSPFSCIWSDSVNSHGLDAWHGRETLFLYNINFL